jgi:hypothetical protein
MQKEKKKKKKAASKNAELLCLYLKKLDPKSDHYKRGKVSKHYCPTKAHLFKLLPGSCYSDGSKTCELNYYQHWEEHKQRSKTK